MSAHDLLQRALQHPSRVGHPITDLLLRHQVVQLPERQREQRCWFSASFKTDATQHLVGDLALILDALSIFALDDLFSPRIGYAASVSLTITAAPSSSSSSSSSSFSSSLFPSPSSVKSDSSEGAAVVFVDMRLAVMEHSFIINMALSHRLDGGSEKLFSSAEHIVWRLPSKSVPSSRAADPLPPRVHPAHSLQLSRANASNNKYNNSLTVFEALVTAADDAAAAQVALRRMPLLNLRKSMYGGAIAAAAADLAVLCFDDRDRSPDSAPSRVVAVLSASARYFCPVPSSAPFQIQVEKRKESGSVLGCSVTFAAEGRALAQVEVTLLRVAQRKKHCPAKL